MSAFLLTILLGFVPLLLLLNALFGRKRREGEPPLVKGWLPFLGKTFQFSRDAHTFLTTHQDKHGDIFTVLIAAKYMTFVMSPLLYPYVVKHGRQLDFHKFADSVSPVTFGYPPVLSERFPGLSDSVQKGFRLLQGESLTALTQSMLDNLLLVMRHDFLSEEGVGPEQVEGPGLADDWRMEGACSADDWQTEGLYAFCNRVMFEATLLTMYGRPAHTHTHTPRHCGIHTLRENFVKFDAMFPLLIARIPIALLGQTNAIRKKLIRFFLPCRLAEWYNPSEFIQYRAELFEQYSTLGEQDKAAHHFAIMWASVGNTIPASFWTLYHLLKHPEAFAAVRAEIRSVVGEGSILSRDITLTREQLDTLVYLESAVRESLRLSSASMNVRVVQEDFSLGLGAQPSVALRKGDIIALYPQIMHMDPEIYPQPEAYKFDRFVEAGKEKTDFYKAGQRLKYYLMPFGSGVSQCPGRFFALNELKQFVCACVWLWELELPPGQEAATVDTSRAGLGILPPARDLTFRYRPRRRTHT